MEYVTHHCSRFQAENLLYHSPAGTFLLRTCQPFSSFFFLSYGEEEKQVVGEDEAERTRLVIKHRMIERTEKGYVSGNTYAGCDSERDESTPPLRASAEREPGRGELRVDAVVQPEEGEDVAK